MSYELRNRPRSPECLCGSVVEHRSTKSEGLRFHSSWGLRARDKTKNVFLSASKYLEISSSVSLLELDSKKRIRTGSYYLLTRVIVSWLWTNSNITTKLCLCLITKVLTLILLVRLEESYTKCCLI